MRLIREDGEVVPILCRPAPLAGFAGLVESCVRELRCGALRAQICLRLEAASAPLPRMHSSAQQVGGGTDAPVIARLRPAPGQVRLAEDLDAWCRERSALEQLSAKHVAKCRRAVERVAIASQWTTRDDLTRDSLAAWLARFVEAGPQSRAKTAKNIASACITFGKWLHAAGRLGANPFLGVPVPRARRGKRWAPFSIAEVRRLVVAAMEREGKRKSKSGPMCSTVYRFMTLTGLRYNECKMQLWEDVDLARGTLVLTLDKSRRGDAIPLPAQAVELLKAWRFHSRGDRLFAKMPSHHSLAKDMRTADVPSQADGRRGQWHRFRKCAVTARRSLGGDLREVAKFARHATTDLTDEVYDMPEIADLRAVADLLPDLCTIEPGGSAAPLDNGPGALHHGGIPLEQVIAANVQTRHTESARRHAMARRDTDHPSVGRSPSAEAAEPGADHAEKWSRGESTSRLVPAVIDAHREFLGVIRLALSREDRDVSESRR